MSPMASAAITFAFAFGGAVAGMVLRSRLPPRHLDADTKDVVKLGSGLIGMTAALVLGLLIASAKDSYDVQNAEVREAAATIVLLDRVLGQYGPETEATRDLLRRTVAARVRLIWPEHGPSSLPDDAPGTPLPIEGIEARIRGLSPGSPDQRWLHARALQFVGDLERTRWLLFGGQGDTIRMPFLVVLIFWISVIFASFGLFARRNPVVIGSFFFCALSIAASVFLVLELDRPFEGVVKIPAGPMRYALERLGR